MSRVGASRGARQIDNWIWAVIAFAFFALVMVAQGAELAAVGGGGSDAGNGGVGVVCRDSRGAIQSVELLDYFEGRQIHGYHLALGDAGMSWKERVKLFFDKMKDAGLEQGIYDDLLTDLEGFEEESAFFTGSKLVDLNDADPLVVPAGCAFEQLAIQKHPEFPGEHYFSINADLWNHATFGEEQKAGLVLHEILYRKALRWMPRKGQEPISNSKPIRHLVSRFSDPSYPSQSIGPIFDLADTLKPTRYGAVHYQGFSLRVDSLWILDDENSRERIARGECWGTCRLMIQGNPVLGFEFEFYRTGALASVKTVDPVVNLNLKGRSVWVDGKLGLSLWEDGNIARLKVLFDPDLDFSEGNLLSLKLVGAPGSRTSMSFDPSGSVSDCIECSGKLRIGTRELEIAPLADNPDSDDLVTYMHIVPSPGDDMPEYYWLSLAKETSIPLFGKEAILDRQAVDQCDG